MQKLAHIINALDDLFKIEQVDSDPSFRQFIPMAYEPIGVDWRGYFDPEFCTRFNGLMIRGREDVGAVFCGVFPSETVIDQFIRHAQPGDLFFSHHALDMNMTFAPLKPTPALRATPPATGWEFRDLRRRLSLEQL